MSYAFLRPLPSPYAGSPFGGRESPASGKPSAEGTTVCLSSDSVQQKSDGFWYFGTIQTWDAGIVYVDHGEQGVWKDEVAAIRQYRSAKLCSSIQPGTESSLHSHPTDPLLAHIKGPPLPFAVLRSPPLSLVYNTDTQPNSTRAGGGAPSTAECIPVPAGQACSARERERHVRGRCIVPKIRHVPQRQLVPRRSDFRAPNRAMGSVAACYCRSAARVAVQVGAVQLLRQSLLHLDKR
jgi:hypothetical protein